MNLQHFSCFLFNRDSVKYAICRRRGRKVDTERNGGIKMGAYQLKNEELTLTVISAGAEMKSLKDNKTEQEYLWQADPKFW